MKKIIKLSSPNKVDRFIKVKEIYTDPDRSDYTDIIADWYCYRDKNLICFQAGIKSIVPTQEVQESSYWELIECLIQDLKKFTL